MPVGRAAVFGCPHQALLRECFGRRHQRRCGRDHGERNRHPWRDGNLHAVQQRRGRFAIDASTGVVTVADASLLNFEANTSHQITVRASDGTDTTDQNFTIAVTDVNEAPTVTSGTTGSVAENAPTSTVVYTATATDPATTAPNNTISWSLTGADASLLSINSSGQVTLNAPASFEAKNSYSFNAGRHRTGRATPRAARPWPGPSDVKEVPAITSNSGGATASVQVRRTRRR